MWLCDPHMGGVARGLNFRRTAELPLPLDFLDTAERHGTWHVEYINWIRRTEQMLRNTGQGRTGQDSSVVQHPYQIGGTTPQILCVGGYRRGRKVGQMHGLPVRTVCGSMPYDANTVRYWRGAFALSLCFERWRGVGRGRSQGFVSAIHCDADRGSECAVRKRQRMQRSGHRRGYSKRTRR